MSVTFTVTAAGAAGPAEVAAVEDAAAAGVEVAAGFEVSEEQPPAASAPATTATRSRAREDDWRIGMSARLVLADSGSFAGTRADLRRADSL
ncbi:hypothetical protein GCM10027262_20850 [Nocardia tengchongensis]